MYIIWMFIIALAAALLIYLLFFMNIVFSLFICLSLSECYIDIKIRSLFGLVEVRRRMDIKQAVIKSLTDDEANKEAEAIHTDQPPFTLETAKQFFSKKIVQKLIQGLHIESIVWRTKLGTGDAAATGRAAGAVWSIKGMLEVWLRQHVTVKKECKMILIPSFQFPAAETTFSCMVKIQTGNAIKTAYTLYAQWKELKYRRQLNHGASD